MMRSLLGTLVAGLGVLMPAAGLMAADAEPAQLRLSHGVWRYDMRTSESDETGTNVKEESSGFTTFPAGIEIAAFWDGYAAYAYPESTGGSFLFGKAFGGNQEAGISFGYNSNNVKDGDESSDTSIGGYYFYSRPLSPSLTFEFDLNPALIMGTEKTTSGGTTQEVDGSGYFLYLDLLGVIPLAKNFEYVFGIDYTMTNVKADVKSGGVSSTVKQSESSLGLILAKFRYFI